MRHLIWISLCALACTDDPEVPSTEDTSSAPTTSTTPTADGELTLSSCSTDIAPDAPAFFQTYFRCVDISMVGGEVQISTDGLPPHPSAYYPEDHANHVPFDDRGGTHTQNRNEIGAQDFEVILPSDPIPKGITIDVALVDTTMGTSDEEFGGGGQGVALNGVEIFAAMAAPGDDLADEQYTFDLYEGHPANTTYHYHFETPGPLEVLVAEGFSSSATPGEGEVEVYGILCDGTVVLGCTELDGSDPSDGDFDAQNGHVHDLSDGSTVHFADRYHTHVCPDRWPDHPFFPEIAYYEETACPVPGRP